MTGRIGSNRDGFQVVYTRPAGIDHERSDWAPSACRAWRGISRSALLAGCAGRRRVTPCPARSTRAPSPTSTSRRSRRPIRSSAADEKASALRTARRGQECAGAAGATRAARRQSAAAEEDRRRARRRHAEADRRAEVAISTLPAIACIARSNLHALHAWIRHGRVSQGPPASALRLRAGQPAEGQRPLARRRHHRSRHGQSRPADAEGHRRQAVRSGARPAHPSLFVLARHSRPAPRPGRLLCAPLRREAQPRHAGRRDARLQGRLRQHGAGDHRARRRDPVPEPDLSDPRLRLHHVGRRHPLHAVGAGRGFHAARSSAAFAIRSQSLWR